MFVGQLRTSICDCKNHHQHYKPHNHHFSPHHHHHQHLHHHYRPHHFKPDPIIFVALPGLAQPIIVSSAALKTMNAGSSRHSSQDPNIWELKNHYLKIVCCPQNNECRLIPTLFSRSKYLRASQHSSRDSGFQGYKDCKVLSERPFSLSELIILEWLVYIFLNSRFFCHFQRWRLGRVGWVKVLRGGAVDNTWLLWGDFKHSKAFFRIGWFSYK